MGLNKTIKSIVKKEIDVDKKGALAYKKLVKKGSLEGEAIKIKQNELI